jgi:hypothetical protein
MVSNQNEALISRSSVDQVSWSGAGSTFTLNASNEAWSPPETGEPMSGFRARSAWHEAFHAISPRERLAQTGERGGKRV